MNGTTAVAAGPPMTVTTVAPIMMIDEADGSDRRQHRHNAQQPGNNQPDCAEHLITAAAE